MMSYGVQQQSAAPIDYDQHTLGQKKQRQQQLPYESPAAAEYRSLVPSHPLARNIYPIGIVTPPDTPPAADVAHFHNTQQQTLQMAGRNDGQKFANVRVRLVPSQPPAPPPTTALPTPPMMRPSERSILPHERLQQQQQAQQQQQLPPDTRPRARSHSRTPPPGTALSHPDELFPPPHPPTFPLNPATVLPVISTQQAAAAAAQAQAQASSRASRETTSTTSTTSSVPRKPVGNKEQQQQQPRKNLPLRNFHLIAGTPAPPPKDLPKDAKQEPPSPKSKKRPTGLRSLMRRGESKEIKESSKGANSPMFISAPVAVEPHLPAFVEPPRSAPLFRPEDYRLDNYSLDPSPPKESALQHAEDDDDDDDEEISFPPHPAVVPNADVLARSVSLHNLNPATSRPFAAYRPEVPRVPLIPAAAGTGAVAGLRSISGPTSVPSSETNRRISPSGPPPVEQQQQQQPRRLSPAGAVPYSIPRKPSASGPQPVPRLVADPDTPRLSPTAILSAPNRQSTEPPRRPSPPRDASPPPPPMPPTTTSSQARNASPAPLAPAPLRAATIGVAGPRRASPPMPLQGTTTAAASAQRRASPPAPLPLSQGRHVSPAPPPLASQSTRRVSPAPPPSSLQAGHAPRRVSPSSVSSVSTRRASPTGQPVIAADALPPSSPPPNRPLPAVPAARNASLASQMDMVAPLAGCDSPSDVETPNTAIPYRDPDVGLDMMMFAEATAGLLDVETRPDGTEEEIWEAMRTRAGFNSGVSSTYSWPESETINSTTTTSSTRRANPSNAPTPPPASAPVASNTSTVAGLPTARVRPTVDRTPAGAAAAAAATSAEPAFRPFPVQRVGSSTFSPVSAISERQMSFGTIAYGRRPSQPRAGIVRRHTNNSVASPVSPVESIVGSVRRGGTPGSVSTGTSSNDPSGANTPRRGTLRHSISVDMSAFAEAQGAWDAETATISSVGSGSGHGVSGGLGWTPSVRSVAHPFDIPSRDSVVSSIAPAPSRSVSTAIRNPDEQFGLTPRQSIVSALPDDEELPNYQESQAEAEAETRRAAMQRAKELQRRWEASHRPSRWG